MDRFDKNIYISNFKEVLVSTGFPIALTGSIFYIAANPPRGTSSDFFKLWLSSAVQVREQLMIPCYFTLGMVSVVMAFMTAFKLADNFSLEPLTCGIVSALSYLALCFPGGAAASYNLEIITKTTGPNGILIALLVSVASVKILKFFNTNKLFFEIKGGVSPSLSAAFKFTFPVMVIIPSMWALGWILGVFLGEPLPSGITTILGYIVSWNYNLARDVIGSIITSLLFFIGMDGSMIKQPLYSVFLNQGGPSTLLPLVLLFMLSTSRHLKRTGSAIIVPLLFNVPYPLIFAAPIILNPIYLIPFVVYPVISTIINYGILASGILSVTVESTNTLPVILSGYFSTTGQVLGILLQLFNFMLAIVIYYPFFRYHEIKLTGLYGSQRENAASRTSLLARIKKYMNRVTKKSEVHS